MEALDLKKSIDLCKNYYDILEERYTKDDNITKEIVNYYKYKIENTDISNEIERQKMIILDECVYTYFNDNKFHENVIMKINTLDKQCDIEDFLLSIYKNYIDDPTNKITTTKWL